MVSQSSKRELVADVRARHTLSNWTAKRQILDELVATTGYQRNALRSIAREMTPATLLGLADSTAIVQVSFCKFAGDLSVL